MKIIDVRETPRTGDRQQVITRDNVAVIVNATIFSQVVDVRLALFTNSELLGERGQARSHLGTCGLRLDHARRRVLPARAHRHACSRQQMEEATDKWGVRINRVEVLEITPPDQILQAMALQKQADQEKRARILESEGQQQSAVNVADGQRQAAIKEAEGAQQSQILRAEGLEAGPDPRSRGSRAGHCAGVRRDQGPGAGSRRWSRSCNSTRCRSSPRAPTRSSSFRPRARRCLAPRRRSAACSTRHPARRRSSTPADRRVALAS